LEFYTLGWLDGLVIASIAFYLLNLAFPNRATADDYEDDAQIINGRGDDLGSEDSAFKNGENMETIVV
jgi:hypothetical protein